MFLQGIVLVRELIDAYGLDVVQAYMGHIQVGGVTTPQYTPIS